MTPPVGPASLAARETGQQGMRTKLAEFEAEITDCYVSAHPFPATRRGARRGLVRGQSVSVSVLTLCPFAEAPTVDRPDDVPEGRFISVHDQPEPPERRRAVGRSQPETKQPDAKAGLPRVDFLLSLEHWPNDLERWKRPHGLSTVSATREN